MSTGLHETWRGWVALPLSIMILFVLLFAGAAQAGSSSWISAATRIAVDFAGPDMATAGAEEELHKQAPSSHGKTTCCSFACAPAFLATNGAGDMLPHHRHETLILSDQPPDTLAGDGLKRPPRPILTDYRHA
jgi:hypothetical protein